MFAEGAHQLGVLVLFVACLVSTRSSSVVACFVSAPLDQLAVHDKTRISHLGAASFEVFYLLLSNCVCFGTTVVIVPLQLGWV